MIGVDWAGLGTFVAALGVIWMQWRADKRADRVERATVRAEMRAARMESKLSVTHDLVNSRYTVIETKLEEALAQLAFIKGKDAERANPGTEAIE